VEFNAQLAPRANSKCYCSTVRLSANTTTAPTDVEAVALCESGNTL
jgi:hypothetical protein